MAVLFFTDRGIKTQIIFGGSHIIDKFNHCYMIKQCGIPVSHVTELPEADLLLIVDGQYGQGNVEKFNAPLIVVVDHHMCMQKENERTFIAPHYQSCSTIICELLEKEGFLLLLIQKSTEAIKYPYAAEIIKFGQTNWLLLCARDSALAEGMPRKPVTEFLLKNMTRNMERKIF